MKYLYGILILDMALLCWANGQDVTPPPGSPPPVGSLESDSNRVAMIYYRCRTIVGSDNPVTNVWYKADTNVPAHINPPTDESWSNQTFHAYIKTAPTNAFAGYIDMAVEMETCTNLVEGVWAMEEVPFKYRTLETEKYFRLKKDKTK
jgi:hypothetical protein